MDRLSELKSHLQDLDDKVTCPICLCVYCKPKLVVPCCHTLCSDCYTAMYSQGGGQFVCPLCREKCTVSPLAAKRNAAMEDLVDEAMRARTEILRLEKTEQSWWPGRLVSQTQCKSEPWDLVLVQHRDSCLFYDSPRKRIVRAEPAATSLPQLPKDLLFCIGDDLEDVNVFSLDGRHLVTNWRLTWPEPEEEQFCDIHRASFDRGTGHLVLSDFVRHQVVIADLAGSVVRVITELQCPTATCVQVSAKRLFVVNNGTRISSFWTADCRPTGAARDGFQLLVDARCDEMQVYATDSEARLVCVLGADGLGLLCKLTLDGQPQFLQLLPPGFLVAVVRTGGGNPNEIVNSSSLVLMSTASRSLTVQKELPCCAKISGLAYHPGRDMLFLCDRQNRAINGFLARPLTFLPLDDGGAL